MPFFTLHSPRFTLHSPRSTLHSPRSTSLAPFSKECSRDGKDERQQKVLVEKTEAEVNCTQRTHHVERLLQCVPRFLHPHLLICSLCCRVVHQSIETIEYSPVVQEFEIHQFSHTRQQASIEHHAQTEPICPAITDRHVIGHLLLESTSQIKAEQWEREEKYARHKHQQRIHRAETNDI